MYQIAAPASARRLLDDSGPCAENHWPGKAFGGLARHCGRTLFMLSHRPVVSIRRAFVAAALAASCTPAASALAEDMSPAVARLRADVTFLADDAREGRG